jgi:hypothetical protein
MQRVYFHFLCPLYLPQNPFLYLLYLRPLYLLLFRFFIFFASHPCYHCNWMGAVTVTFLNWFYNHARARRPSRFLVSKKTIWTLSRKT